MKKPKLAPLTIVETGITYSFFIYTAVQHPTINPNPPPTIEPIKNPNT